MEMFHLRFSLVRYPLCGATPSESAGVFLNYYVLGSVQSDSGGWNAHRGFGEPEYGNLKKIDSHCVLGYIEYHPESSSDIMVLTMNSPGLNITKHISYRDQCIVL